MKTVTLTTDLRPWRAGDSVPIPDLLADKLVASGEAKDPRPFPEGAPDTSRASRSIPRVKGKK